MSSKNYDTVALIAADSQGFDNWDPCEKRRECLINKGALGCKGHDREVDMRGAALDHFMGRCDEGVCVAEEL